MPHAIQPMLATLVDELFEGDEGLFEIKWDGYRAVALVENGDLHSGYAYRIWPCTNPSGYALGTRESADGVDINRSFGRGGQTPESRAIITANRNRKFPLSLDLHEDTDADGFYCYEYGDGAIGRRVIDAVRASGFPIQDLARCDLGAPFERTELDDGVVRPMSESEIAAIGGLSYNLSLSRHAARCVLTFETPVKLPWEDLDVESGRVPGRFLLGKAFFVYWPAGYRPPFYPVRDIRLFSSHRSQ